MPTAETLRKLERFLGNEDLDEMLDVIAEHMNLSVAEFMDSFFREFPEVDPDIYVRVVRGHGKSESRLEVQDLADALDQGKWARCLCPVCLYDLRASVDRCPECGTPIPQEVMTTPDQGGSK